MSTPDSSCSLNRPSRSKIDFGDFGNSRPFRIRITNLFNDNSDYFYVKHADASRIYGLELEHILSPNRINYIVNGTTLIEEHIAGVPGDVFLSDHLTQPGLGLLGVTGYYALLVANVDNRPGDDIILGTDGGSVFAFDAKGGQLWSTPSVENRLFRKWNTMPSMMPTNTFNPTPPARDCR